MVNARGVEQDLVARYTCSFTAEITDKIVRETYQVPRIRMNSLAL